jgi:hypothetical protein
MAKKIPIKHKETGIIKNGYYGFSWTYLFFGWLVPCFRGELDIAALHLLFSIMTIGLWQIIVSFIYNKQYMTRMLMGGWELAGTEDQNIKASIALDLSIKG